MTTILTIGRSGSYTFSAAHAGLHDGQFEPLHGHTYTVILKLRGEPGADGLVCDFTAVKHALEELIRPLRRRTILAAQAPGIACEQCDGEVRVQGGGKRYSFPATDVVLLPVLNSSTEEIAGYLLRGLLPQLDGDRVQLAELTLAESPDASATVSGSPPGPLL